MTDSDFRIVIQRYLEPAQYHIRFLLDRDEILKSSLAADYVKLVNDILTREMANTIEILEKAKDKIQSMADVLVRENRLTGEEFEKLMNE